MSTPQAQAVLPALHAALDGTAGDAIAKERPCALDVALAQAVHAERIFESMRNGAQT